MVLGLVVMVGSSIQGYRAWRKSRGADGSNDQIEQQPKRPHDIEREGLTELQRVRYMDIILNATPTHEGHIDYVRQQVYEALMANRSVLEDCGFCHKPILGDE